MNRRPRRKKNHRQKKTPKKSTPVQKVQLQKNRVTGKKNVHLFWWSKYYSPFQRRRKRRKGRFLTNVWNKLTGQEFEIRENRGRRRQGRRILGQLEDCGLTRKRRKREHPTPTFRPTWLKKTLTKGLWCEVWYGQCGGKSESSEVKNFPMRPSR